MRISVTGSWKSKRLQIGFTLLEVMVVLVIIGVITGFAVLSVNYGSVGRLDEEARRLERLLSLARDEAIFLGRQYGVRFRPNSYEFCRLQAGGEWLPLNDSEWLPKRELPSGIQLKLAVEGANVDLGAAVDKPQIFFLSSGESSAFVLHIETPEQRVYRLQADAFGQLGIETLH